MIIENVYSPVDDKNIKNNLQNSPIWKEAYKIEELQIFPKKEMYCYKIKFDGLKPIQFLKVEVLSI